MTHFLRCSMLALGVALAMIACSGKTIDERLSDAGTSRGMDWGDTGFAAGGAFGGGGKVGGAGWEAAGGTTVEAGGRTAAGGTTVGTGGWAATGGTIVATGGAAAATDAAAPATDASGGNECCDELPSCAANEVQIAGFGACGDGGCRSVTKCCKTITCVPLDCELSCKPGQWFQQGACSPNSACTTHTSCGITFACYWPVDAGVEDGGHCRPTGILLFSEDQAVCAGINFASCLPNTRWFWSTCGCGCVQDESCPAVLDCKAPPENQDPSCEDTTRCPFTTRAF